MSDEGSSAGRREFMRALRARHPGFREAVVADLRVTAFHRGERSEFTSGPDVLVQVLRMAWVSDAFLGLMLYRSKARLQALGVPLLPRLAHRLAMALAQITIGDPVIVHPGVYVVHGQIVLDGLVEVHSGVVISPFVTLGLRAGNVAGPTIGPGVSIGTGAKVIGPVNVGAGALIGANAVVVEDVPDGATVVGVPAGEVARSRDVADQEAQRAD
jgi:serine O-acetyltransferase